MSRNNPHHESRNLGERVNISHEADKLGRLAHALCHACYCEEGQTCVPCHAVDTLESMQARLNEVQQAFDLSVLDYQRLQAEFAPAQEDKKRMDWLCKQEDCFGDDLRTDIDMAMKELTNG